MEQILFCPLQSEFLSLLSTKQLQIELKFILNCSSMSLTLLSLNARQESSAYNRKMSGPRIEPCKTPDDDLPCNEDSFLTFTNNVLFVR